MGFPREEHWSGLPFPFEVYLPDPEIEPISLASPALAGRFFTTEPLGKRILLQYKLLKLKDLHRSVADGSGTLNY